MQFDHDYDVITPSSLISGVDTITFGGNAGIDIPAGSTVQRPFAPIPGSLRYNNTTLALEWYTGSGWASPSTTVASAPTYGIQYNVGGAFTAASTFLYDVSTPATPRITLTTPLNNSGIIHTLLRLSTVSFVTQGQFARSSSAAIQVDASGDAFQAQFTGSGRYGSILLTQDNAPFMKLLESTTFCSYIELDSVGTGSEATPQHRMKYGVRSSAKEFSSNAGAIPGWQWIYNDVFVANLDPQAFTVPRGTTASRPGNTDYGMIRYNTSTDQFEGCFVGFTWAPFLNLSSQAKNAVLAAPNSAAGTPTFRALSLAGNDLADVLITTPIVNQVLAWNGTGFVNTGAVGSNASGLVGVGQAFGAAWSVVSGNTYGANFVHNLGTTNIVITVFDSATLAVVIPSLVTCSNTNTVNIQVSGNTRTLKVVVVANGNSIVAGGSTPSSIIVQQAGTTVGTTTTKLNFIGQATTVSDAGANTTNVMIGSRFSFFANSLDSPIGTDYAVAAMAAVVTDANYVSINQRSFSNTVEQGVAFMCSIPPAATNMTFKFRGRPITAPGVVSVVQPRIYSRILTNSGAIGTWSAAYELANITIPATLNFIYATQTVTLAALGLTADALYQFELTRRIAGITGTQLASVFYLTELTVEFS